MAATVKVEIPIEATDKTASGVNSAKKNFTALEKSIEKTEKQLEKLGKTHCKVDVDADDKATSQLHDVESATEKVSGLSADVEVGADDNASPVINGVSDSVSRLNGASADAELGADDNATPVVSAASDAVDAFDGMSGDAEIGVDDSATQVVTAAQDAVEAFSGVSGDAAIGVDDNASPVIDAAKDKGESFDGSVWTATLQAVDNTSSAISSTKDSVSGSLSGQVATAAGILGVSTSAAEIISTYSDFEATMSKVKALANATDSEMTQLTEKAKEMGAATKYSGTESAEAFTYMAQAGWSTQSMIDGIGGIMSLAASDGIGLAEATDIVANALTSFGMTASDTAEFADTLAVASSATNTDVSGLGEAFKYVAPVAGALKYSVQDVSLALGLMSNNGVKGSMAGTALKTSLANLASPTDSMAEAMEKYGISLTDSEGNMKSLHGVLDNLREGLGGLSEAEQTAAASTIFWKEAMAGMLAIINTSEEDYKSLTDQIENSTGAADRMAETMQDNLAGTIEQLGGSLETLQLTIGEQVEPLLTSAANGLAAKFESINELFSSEEWTNADLFGKIDIAWDKIVAEPFTKWVGSSGKNLLTKGLSSLFSSALKILPGGEEAGLSSWLSAGILGTGLATIASKASGAVEALAPVGSAIKGVVSAASEASSVGGFISSIGEMIPMAGKVGLAAAGIAAAVAIIGTAINEYNQTRATNDLAEHFGTIELSAEQAAAAAEGILDMTYLVNVELALNEIKNADEMRTKAEEALEANQALTWKSSVGIELTADEQSDYTSNIETFVDSKISELESRTYSAYLSVNTFLAGTEEGEDLSSQIQEWARADNLELTELSSDLTEAVQNALQDGIIDVDEAQAVAELQTKINNITSQWKQAESQAQLDWINQEYGSMSGKNLEVGSYQSIVEALTEQRATAAEETQSLATEFYAFLNAAESSGRITSSQNKNYHTMASQAIRNQQAEDLMTSLSFETNTMNDTYGEALQSNYAKTQSNMEKQLKNLSQYAQSGDITSLMDTMMYGNNSALQGGGWDITQSATQNNLDDLWEVMKPDADAMKSTVDEYVNAGQAIPKQIMDSFNSAMEMGAASGDADAAWQVYANSIAQSGDEALIEAVGQMAENGALGDEFSAAWKRATAEVTEEPVTLEGLKAEIDGDGEILNKDEWVSSLNEKLGDLAETTDVTAEGATITVKSGDCLWEIGNALGVDWQTIAEQNGIESPYVIHAGDELTISMDDLTVDAQGAQEAIDSAMSALTAEGGNFTVTADGVQVDLTNVTVDSETAMAQIEAALGMESGTLSAAGIDVSTGATVTIPSELVTVDTSGMQSAIQETTEVDPAETSMSANVTVTDATTDASAAKASADAEVDQAFSETHETSGSADVTIDQTNNADEVYSQVGSDLRSKFGTTFSVSANASIHVNYSIANPTASISFSGGGTGSATVSAALNASGGEVGLNGPELSWVGEEGPEYIIPTVPGRRGRGISLWEQAGQALGVLDSNGEIAGHANGGIVGPNDEQYANDAIIPLEEDDSKSGTVWSVNGEPMDSNSGESSDGKQVTINAEPQGQAGNNTFDIKVDMSPVIKIDGNGMDEQKVFEVIQSRVRELADDLGDEIGERMMKIFENMPMVQEA